VPNLRAATSVRAGSPSRSHSKPRLPTQGPSSVFASGLPLLCIYERCVPLQRGSLLVAASTLESPSQVISVRHRCAQQAAAHPTSRSGLPRSCASARRLLLVTPPALYHEMMFNELISHCPSKSDKSHDTMVNSSSPSRFTRTSTSAEPRK